MARSEFTLAASQTAPAAADSARLQCRRGQRISLETVGADAVFIVEQGCLTCDVLLGSGERHIIMVLYPGDQMYRSLLPPLPGLGLTAASPSVLTRTVLASSGEAGSDAAVAAAALEQRASLADSTARLLARTALYATAMGRLSAEERLSTLLCDVALHLGKQAPGGYTFELPLSRRDMADHLALNPDSLSRLMSRLKARGLLALPSRTRAIARDLEALLATTPFGPTLQAMRDKAARSERLVDGPAKQEPSAKRRPDYSTTRR